jgi:fructokinase
MLYTVGEIVLDVICKSFDQMVAKPGGSMLNTAITIGRLKVPVKHISYLSTDQNGKLILDFLTENGIGNQLIFCSDDIRTNIAFAHLDELNNAHYTFYKDDLDDYAKLIWPSVQKGDMILFGSFFSLNEKIRPFLVPFLKQAKANGAFLIYDPNFRSAHKKMLNQVLPFIEENFNLAHLVKGSDEDFSNIFGIKTGPDAWQKAKAFGVKALVYTKGKEGADLYSNQNQLQVKSNVIQPLSTIGAGDTFSAGLIYRLLEQNQFEAIINDHPVNWYPALETANKFAAQVCMSFDNYLSMEYILSNHV